MKTPTKFTLLGSSLLVGAALFLGRPEAPDSSRPSASVAQVTPLTNRAAPIRAVDEYETIAVAPRGPVPASRVERRWLDAGSLSEFGIKAIESEDFDRTFARLKASSDAATLAKTQRYQELLNEVLSQSPSSGSLDRVVCGDRICMAVISSSEHQGEDALWLPTLWPTALAMDLSVGGLIKSYKVGPSGLATLKVVFIAPASP